MRCPAPASRASRACRKSSIGISVSASCHGGLTSSRPLPFICFASRAGRTVSSTASVSVPSSAARDRKSVVEGKRGSVRVNLGGRRRIKKKKKAKQKLHQTHTQKQ